MEFSIENKQYLFGLFFLVANKLQYLGDQITGDLTLKQWFLLNMVKHHVKPGSNYNDIAKIMHVTRQNITKMLRILEQKGYVQITPSLVDSRSNSIFLTDKTERYFKTLENSGNFFLDTVFHDISASDLFLLNDSLQKIYLNLHSRKNKE